MLVEPTKGEAALSTRSMARADEIDKLSTTEMRERFLVSGLFQPGAIQLVYTDLDRMVIGGVVPAWPMRLPACPEFGTAYFTERRELGVLNIGAAGQVRVGDQAFSLNTFDCLYIGSGEKEIVFAPEDRSQPVFYLVSCTAHRSYPTKKITVDEASVEWVGSAANASRRRIYRCIHPGGAESCQLVMGYTRLEPGSVWNTMPPHTHRRRSEIYLYTELGEDIVVHLMGEPERTRSLIVRNREAVLSPPWSIHTASGTRDYAFVWAMAGENQEFADMDPVDLTMLL